MSSTLDLPDINVWLALVDERHVHHQAAAVYWREDQTRGIAFSRITMLGFLRLSTHPHTMKDPLSPGEAWEIYRRFQALPNIRFLSEPGAPSLDEVFSRLSQNDDFPRRLWTDAYLAALAISSGSRLVSFDDDFARFEGLSFLHLVA